MAYFVGSVEMPGELQQLYKEFLAELETIRVSDNPSLLQAERGVGISLETLSRLRSWVEKNPFLSQEGEIQFFKHIKPRFYCQLLFFQQLYTLEMRKPEGGPKSLRKYYKRKVLTFSEYCEEHFDLYLYFRRKETYLDKLYFLRMAPREGYYLETIRPDADPSFSTALDYLVAEMLKNELMLTHLVEQLRKPSVPQGTAALTAGLKWTGTLSGLYELIYALRRAGVINNGNVTISQLVEFFEPHFGVSLKNIYRGNQENQIKKEPGAFLKMLLRKYLEDSEEADERPGRRK